MPMIGPMPPSPEPPAAPTPWSFNKWSHEVRDARGNHLFEINGEALDPDEDAALARELVDLVNRAATVDPVPRPAERTAQGSPEAPTVCLPATVETYNGVIWFEVNRQSPPGFAEIRVIDGFGETICVFDPSSARTLAYALLAAAGAAPVEGPAEPDPGDPSTWRRYVDEVGDEWFEFAPGLVRRGSREGVGNWVQSLIDDGGDPANYPANLDDARELYGLRPA